MTTEHSFSRMTPLPFSKRLGGLLGTWMKALLICSALQPMLLWAAPSQSPLLNRPPKPVPPNVFFTFDDSGSMAWHAIPDAQITNITVNSANTYPALVPEDNLAQPNNFNRCIVQTHDASNRTFNLATASNENASRVAYMQFRSAAFNLLYYNPNTYYRPWMKPDGTEFPFVTDPTRAPIDPLNQIQASSNGLVIANSVRSTATANLTRTTLNLSTGGNATTTWCNINSSANRNFGAAFYYQYNSANNTFTPVNISANPAINLPTTKHADRIDCLGAACTRAEELKNFANWFTYYRTRNFLAIGAASRAFGSETADIRMGYGRINNTASVEGAPATVLRGVRDFTVGTTDRNNFFGALYTMPASGATPLRRAMDDVGRYFQIEGDKGPWGNNPGPVGSPTVNTAGELACRKSYHMLMTDGYWNGAAANVATGNVDNIIGPNITGPNNQSFIYRPTTAGIYKDNYQSTLADVAMYYWNRDLHPNLNNELKPSPGSNATTDIGDHGFWQHLTTYTVGLGVLGTVPTNTIPTTWPQPVQNTPTAVDDLYHAAVNGRGKYVSAGDSAAFEAAIQNFLQAVQAAEAVKTGSAVSSLVFSTSNQNQRFSSEYDPNYWTGDVKSFNTDAYGVITTMRWSANAQMPAPGDRQIFTWNGTAGVNFDTALPAGLKAASLWGGTAPSDDLINFLRGDRTNEGSMFRCRGAAIGETDCTSTISQGLGKIGDVVNATPVFVKSRVDYAYEYLPTQIAGGGTYRDFVARKRNRGAGVVFVGANDGMLHGFHEQTGAELFAFVPNGVFGNLSALADINYGSTKLAGKGHRFFVDGPITETDAYLSGAWNNLLLGSAGAGGRSVFAIRVDAPTSATGGAAAAPTFNASNIRWELNDSNSTRLGYVMQPIETGPMKNGQWVAIFGNGPDSADGGAHLFIVNLSNGAIIRTIAAGAASGNGLGGVTVLRDANQVIVGAYAGDLTGKVWRFDLESDTSGNWKLGRGGSPLFDAGKPITAAPAVVSHPQGGVMVIAGTGRFIYDADLNDSSQQNLYGLWDKTVVGLPSASLATIGAGNLITQSFTPKTIAGDTRSYWTLSDNSIDWTTKQGWAIPLTLGSGQRHVFAPQIVDDYALVPTIAPVGTSSGCVSTSGNQFTLLINPITGGSVSNAPWGASQTAYAGKNDIISVPKNPSGNEYRGDSGQADSNGQRFPVSGYSQSAPERRWIQILNFPRQ